MKSQTNEELIRLAKGGDMDAFAELFEELRAPVFAVACRLVGQNDADDVVMDSFLKAWKAMPNFSERSSLKTWLYRLTHNCATDLLRRRTRERNRFVQTGDEEGDKIIESLPETRGKSPVEALVETESNDAVDQALNKLPEVHRTTILLRFAEDLSYGEIAAATGVGIGTVMSRLFNAKRKIKQLLN